MWGFAYRATVGAVRNFARGRLSGARLLQSWLAAASLPLVFAGWVRDFWEPFEWYLGVEKGLPATYFLIPFKRRAGQKVPGRHGARRATAYDVGDLGQWCRTLTRGLVARFPRGGVWRANGDDSHWELPSGSPRDPECSPWRSVSGG